MAPLDRLPTGIATLDLILNGGLLRGGAYIVQGHSGAGKTVLANQIASHRIGQGGRVVYLTLLSEGHDRMMAHLAQMSFFHPEALAGRLIYISGYTELETNGLSGLSRLVRTEVERHGAELIVLDGLFAVEETASSAHAFRRLVHELQAHAHVTGQTMLLLTNSRHNPASPEYTMVDGWIEMADVRAEGRVVRELEVHKFRGERRHPGPPSLQDHPPGHRGLSTPGKSVRPPTGSPPRHRLRQLRHAQAGPHAARRLRRRIGDAPRGAVGNRQDRRLPFTSPEPPHQKLPACFSASTRVPSGCGTRPPESGWI
ncbi:RAD55 family ATPase [Azospirillum doebereinerae]|uniref:RAD55 family ATPase n=1 Tax=Azospirillum doebereinerae TaxID=92933 RepID=UPI0038509A64